MEILLLRLFQMSIWGSVLAAIILIVKRFAGERLSAAFHYTIWSVLILRLVIPLSVSYVQPLAVTESERPPLTRQAAETAQTERDMLDATQKGQRRSGFSGTKFCTGDCGRSAAATLPGNGFER